MTKIEDCTVVIRSVGERTEQACFGLLEGIFPSEHITVISDTPFAATLRKALQHGLKQNRVWTLCIDADVLVAKDAITELFSRAARFDDSYFEFHGFIGDKFFQDIRPAGNHLYKTKHLEQAIRMIPEEGISLRPETYMLKAMEKVGVKHQYFSDLVVGIHDYEQFHADIFNKGYLHSHKHIKHMSKLLPQWKEQAKTDSDFKVLLWGVGCGIAHDGDGYADKSKTPYHLFDLLSNGLEEKAVLKIDTISHSDIQEIIKTLQLAVEKPTVKSSGILRKLRNWVR